VNYSDSQKLKLIRGIFLRINLILCQSAAIAACIAIDKKEVVQDVTYENLKEKLLDRKQVLTLQ